MKLIRLVSDDNNGFFNNDFHEDIVVKPNSKLALQSVSFETKVASIQIDSSNDEITILYSNDEQYAFTINLDHATYTSATYENLFIDIQNKINEKIGYDVSTFPLPRSLGMEWQCRENSKGKVEIRYKIGQSAEYALEWTYDKDLVERTITAGRKIWKQKTSGNNGNNASCLFAHYISRGCGYIRTRTHEYTPKLAVPENNGYIIGLSTTNLAELEPADITDDMLTYGIAVSSDNGSVRRYYSVSDGVYTLSAVSPNYNGVGDTQNDYQEVIVNFNKIEFNVYQNGSPTKIQVTTPVDYTPGQRLFPFFLFRDNNVSLNALSVTGSPFGTPFDPPTTTEELTAPPQQDNFSKEKNYLEFEGNSLAKFLGYENLRQPSTGFYEAIQFTYTADRTFDATDVADAFIVELLNLRCESYDGLLNQRKNILSVIPKSNSTGEVIYEMSNPIFIDLNNAKDILLRNLRLRIVKPDYSSIEMLGQGTVVLLLDSN